MTTFDKLLPDGTTLRVFQAIEISHADLLRCPHVILVPEHYRPDGTCRCNDATHTVMKEWGYVWSSGRWK